MNSSLQATTYSHSLTSGCAMAPANRKCKRAFALAIAVCLGGMSVISGCEAKKPWETTVPVAGSVTFNGQPVAGAQITLYPRSAEVPTSVRPSATSGPDGRFQVGTYANQDGAPVGEYAVAIIWHPLVKSASGPVRGDNKLPLRYAKPETSGVSASVDTGGGTLPTFALKK